MIAFVLFAFAILFFGYFSFRKPSSLIAFAFCVFSFEQLLQSQSSYFVTNGTIVNLTMLVMCIFALAISIVTGKFTIPKVRTYWLILALLLYAYSTFFWLNDASGTGYDKWISNIPYLICVTFVCACFVRDTNHARGALLTTLVFGTGICIFLTFFSGWSGRGLVLAQSSKADLASSVLALASLGNYAAVIGGLIEIPKFKPWKILRWLCIALGLYLSLKSQSRGQVIILIVVIIAFTPVSKGQISLKSVLIAIIVVIGVAICLYVLLPYVSTTRWSEEKFNSAFLGRTNMASGLWKAYSDQLPAYWITGLGAGKSFDIVGFYIHNVPLEVLCEEGIIGAVLYCFIIGIPTITFLSIVTSKQTNFFSKSLALQRNTLVIIFALMITEFALSLKSGSLYGFQNFFLLIIMVEILGREIKQEEKISAYDPSQIYATQYKALYGN